MEFILHPQLSADTIFITDLKVCKVLLMNNSNFPWLILVPMQENIVEIYDLSDADYTQAMLEIRKVAKAFAEITGADKMNVATLGNVVPQLHIHIIARFKNDAAFPKPVWSVDLPASPYSDIKAQQVIEEIKEIMKNNHI